MRVTEHAVGTDKAHGDAVGFTRDIEPDFIAVQPHRAAALALHRAADQLARYLPLAFAEHVIDRSADRRQPAGDLAIGHANRKPLRKFLRDEAGGKIAAAPA